MDGESFTMQNFYFESNLIYWRKPNVYAHCNPRKSRAKTISIQEVGGFYSFAASAQQIVDLLEDFPPVIMYTMLTPTSTISC
jgi:hypothetical protein